MSRTNTPFGGPFPPSNTPPSRLGSVPPSTYPSQTSINDMHSYTPYPTNEVDDERAPLSANAADFGQNNTGFYPPRTDNQFPPGPGFLSQDPRMRRPAPQRAPSAAQSEAEWKARAATVKRGATRRVKLTRDGHFVGMHPFYRET